MDASSDRDFAVTFLYACAMTMVHPSRLAEDLIILCGDEHRFFSAER
jgi:argininosuccinate lyase